jgi:hypothetical protein
MSRRKRWFQFSHCELSIFMKQHPSRTCIYGVYISQLTRCSLLVAPVMISLRDCCCQQGSYWTKWLSWTRHYSRYGMSVSQMITDNCSGCRNHNLVLFSFMIFCHDMTGATCGVGTAYPSGAPEFTTSFFVEFMFLDL